MNSSESESDGNHIASLTLPEIIQASKQHEFELLPAKSRKSYEAMHESFMQWRQEKKVKSFTENVLLAFFMELSEKYKSSSLWSKYSMLKSTLSIKNGIDIENYTKLRAFLKRKSEGYRAKKAKTFTPEEIMQFINKASDEKYLATKVVLIMGIMGACRSKELYAMNVKDVEDLGSAFLISVPKIKSRIIRKFTVSGRFYDISKKYADLRPPNATSASFFLNFLNGKCTDQRIGMNKFAAMGKHIAKFLELPNSQMYTGHTFCRSSATLLVDEGGDITSMKRLGGWKSTSVTEKYMDKTVQSKIDMARNIVANIAQTSSITNECSVNKNININSKGSIPSMNFDNCSHLTFNILDKKPPLPPPLKHASGLVMTQPGQFVAARVQESAIPPKELSFEGNMSENWEFFVQKFKIFLIASGQDKEDEKKKAYLLLNRIGDEGLRIYNTFTFEAEAHKEEYTKIINKFNEKFTADKNETYQRYEFNTKPKLPEQSYDDYCNELRRLADSCNFGDLTDSLIRDRLILAIPEMGLKEKLLQEPRLTLEKAMDICRVAEVTKEIEDLAEKKNQFKGPIRSIYLSKNR